MLRSLAIVVVLGALARADAVDPAKLPELAIPAGTAAAKVRVFATGVDAAVLIGVLSRESFVARAGQKRITGRFGDPATEGVPVDAAIAALKDGVALVHPGVKGKGPGVSLDFNDGSATDLLRLCAAVASVDYVVAPVHALPNVVVRMHDVPVQAAAIAIASAVGMQLIERGDVWAFIDSGAKLDEKLAATTTRDAWIEVRDARAGEVRLLLDAKDPSGPCGDANISAKLRRGQSGILDAAARTVTTGAPCVAPDDIDLDAAKLVGTLTSPKIHRALLREKDRGFALGTQSDSTGHGTMHAPLGGDKSIEPPASSSPPHHPFTDASAGGWRLAATISVGVVWQAIFDGGGSLRVVKRETLFDHPEISIDIDASHAWSKDRAFSLAR